MQLVCNLLFEPFAPKPQSNLNAWTPYFRENHWYWLIQINSLKSNKINIVSGISFKLQNERIFHSWTDTETNM